MFDPTYDEFRRCMYCLDESAVKRLVRTVCQSQYDPEQMIECRQQVQICLADWFAHLGVLTDAQVGDVLRAFEEQIATWSVTLLACRQADGPKPVLTMAIADGRWLSCCGRDKFFDAQEAEELDKLPEPAVTHIMCDVTALYFRMLRRLAMLRRAAGPRKEAVDVSQLDQRPAGVQPGNPRTLGEFVGGSADVPSDE